MSPAHPHLGQHGDQSPKIAAHFKAGRRARTALTLGINLSSGHDGSHVRGLLPSPSTPKHAPVDAPTGRVSTLSDERAAERRTGARQRLPENARRSRRAASGSGTNEPREIGFAVAGRKNLLRGRWRHPPPPTTGVVPGKNSNRLAPLHSGTRLLCGAAEQAQERSQEFAPVLAKTAGASGRCPWSVRTCRTDHFASPRPMILAHRASATR